MFHQRVCVLTVYRSANIDDEDLPVVQFSTPLQPAKQPHISSSISSASGNPGGNYSSLYRYVYNMYMVLVQQEKSFTTFFYTIVRILILLISLKKCQTKSQIWMMIA